VTAILPSVLSTMDKDGEDTKQISTILKMWAIGESRPQNGAFVIFDKIKGKKGETLLMPK